MRALSAPEVRLWLAAFACFAAFATLGAYVAARAPTRIDVAGTALRGTWTPLATFFTALGRWWVVVPVSLLGWWAALALRASPVAVGAILASQALSQAVAGAAKNFYGRARPDAWLVYREHGLSYPSGHAATSVVFYAALALAALRTAALPRGLALGCAAGAAVCLVGIPWSRLALGAHYATDVAGGLLFGAGWLCATLALLYRFGIVF